MTLPAIAAFGNGGNWNNRFDDAIKFTATNPVAALRELDREDCKTLKGFTKVFWPVVEPGRPLVEGWCLDAIDDHLTAVSKGQIRKLLMNVPPGCMKSLKTGVFWPAFEWGPLQMPWLRYICASYNADLTVRDNRRCRMILDSPRYRELYGTEGLTQEELDKPSNRHRFSISGDQDAKIKFENTHRGWKIATSVKGGVVGERGDRFIIDDPHNIKSVESMAEREGTLQWFTEIVPSRVNDPDKATFIIIMQRVHERDISGLVLAKELGYEHLCLPMEWEKDHPHRSSTSIGFVDPREKEGVEGALLWPERYPESAVEELKQSLRAWGGGYAEAGQLQQRPAPRGGGMFPRVWWRFYDAGNRGYHLASRPNGCSDSPAVPLPSRFDQLLISVDAAFKANESGSRVSILVIGVFGPFRYVIENVTKHMTFKQTCDTLATFSQDGRSLTGGLLSIHRADRVLIEDKANGPAIIDTLREKISGIIPVSPEGGKEARGNAIAPSVESGHVLLPDGAPWLEDFISEFASFPVGARDDQVDSLSQAMIYLVTDADVGRAISMARL